MAADHLFTVVSLWKIHIECLVIAHRLKYTAAAVFMKELVWSQNLLLREVWETTITALEEITKLLSAFSSKTVAVFYPFSLKGVPNLCMSVLKGF